MSRTGTGLGPGTLVLIGALGLGVTGCDHPFEPHAPNTIGPFSIFGYLDVNADTQWVRVTPIRQQLLTDPEPLDAVVTLEHLASGRVVMLRDSVFAFPDPSVDGVGYAHNFWTTEPIEAEASYRLEAVRADGATTIATVEMPSNFEIGLRFGASRWSSYRLPRQMFATGENLLYGEVIYTTWDNTGTGRPGPPTPERLHPRAADAGWELDLPGIGPFDGLSAPPLVDVHRREARVVVARSDWPYRAGLTPTEVAIPAEVPTTVENGLGSLVGVAIRTIPLAFCDVIEARPGEDDDCRVAFNERSASITGEVDRESCADPRPLPEVRLTERYPEGGAVAWVWKTDWRGAYRFDGLEPGAEFRLEFGDDVQPIDIPPLAPGERFIAPDVALPGC